MQSQLLQTRQALGRGGNPQTQNIAVSHELVVCFICPRAKGFTVSSHPPLCPAATLLSQGDLDEGVAVQPRCWQNPHLPFM